MSEPQAFDVVVIGAGPAGVSAAVAAAQLGKTVAVAEKNMAVGGAALNTGTVPSKTLRETALALSGLRSRELYGVDLSLRRECTVADLLRREHSVMGAERTRWSGFLGQYGVTMVPGAARFLDAHTIAVAGPTEERVLRANFVIIAIGSSPSRPPLFPFEHPRVHDSDEIVNLEQVPKSLAVVGAGVVGSEYACTFAALGAPVHVLDGRDCLMPFLDLEVAQALTSAMTNLGITFHWKEQVTACEAPATGDLKLTLASGKVLLVDAVLVAAGRESRTAALDPDKACLLVGKRGQLCVDECFRTNVKHIYAAGDVVGFPALASISSEQGRIAAAHACGDTAVCSMPAVFPTGIFTIPEVGAVGDTEGALQGKGVAYVVGRAEYMQTGRGAIIGDRTGFLKLLFAKDDLRLLGAHAMGEQATELVHLGLIVLQAGGGADFLWRTCFNYPTLGDLYKLAAHEAMLKRVQTG
ncbi:MAG TPA: Si-specific NAD(P)(+) transhydrogenase [Gemmataceae bacterium]|nr:Si-specific NAD(P)(+) transhydrogenase [Gemmataceae bacterium]